MTTLDGSRYRLVSRRALLKGTVGVGFLAATAACGVNDSEIFAGAVAQPVPSTTSTTNTTTTSTSESGESTTTQATATGPAVMGEMVVEVTYTRSAGGKIASPYVAIWVEDEAGDLVETVALFYQQDRKGARWLDHLDRWFTADAARIAAGGTDDAAVISSATRPPGEYAVVWDGTVNGDPVPAGTYNIYIESAREEGPVSLTSATVVLNGTLPSTTLPDDGELSSATVRIDG